MSEIDLDQDVSELLLGEILLARGQIQAEDIEKALSIQVNAGGRIGTALIRVGALSEENLLLALVDQLGTNLITVEAMPDLQVVHQFMVASQINFDWFLSHEAIVWQIDEHALCCASRDILNPDLHETLTKFFPDKLVDYRLLSSYSFEDAARILVQEDRVGSLFQGSDDARHLRELAEEAPIVELVNNILSQAVDADASDVHVEPREKSFKIRFRIDGVLRDQFSQPAERFPAVASRIKLVSGLDIAERRLPQDGRITSRIAGSDMDLRVSTLPGVFGESIVMRLLPKNRESLSLQNLGLESDHLLLMKAWAESSGGIVLVTGPTGSGKSTTLHGALSATNDGIRKIITVEDPVEIQLDGITQIQVHADIGYTFGRALRAILRQDPDVIMIGEIRDLETAEIAIQSALSGHLVLSTLHTNDAISAFTRLIDMGIEPFLVAAPLKGVQAQRLVRRLCAACSTAAKPIAEFDDALSSLPAELLGKDWREARGCPKCMQTGYSGRLGIYQLVPVDDVLQDMIVKGASLNDMRAYSVAQGNRTLFQDGLIKASNGLTSIDEVLRVVASDESK